MARIGIAAMAVALCCGASFGANLELFAATFLGGAGVDEATALEIAPDRTIVYAGRIDGPNYGRTPALVQGGGPGAILRVDATGTQVLSVTRFPATVEDMEVDPVTGHIAAIGTFGAVLLSPDGSTQLWHKPFIAGDGGSTAFTGRRIAVGSDGTVGVLFGKQFFVYDRAGESLGSGTMPHDHVSDIAVVSENNLVTVTGFDQRSTCDNPVQVAVIKAFEYTGGLRWKLFGFAATRENFCGSYGNQMADTRGLLLAMGRDGMLYFAGESAGGNCIYRYNGLDLQTSTLVIGDRYNHAYNTSSNHITYYARIDPAAGRILKGQLCLTRLNDGGGNTLNPRAIAADESGFIYVGGNATYHVDPSNLPTVEGDSVSHAGGFILVVDSGFGGRVLWTTFEDNSTDYASGVKGIDGGLGLSAVAATAKKSNMILKNPLQTTTNTITSTNTEGYLAVWEGYTEWAGVSVRITAPAPDVDLSTGDNVTVTASVTGENAGVVTGVEFFVDGGSIGTVTSAPYTLTWNDAPEGYHTLKAAATANGKTAYSPTLTVLVKDDPVLTSVRITPPGIRIIYGASYQFTAEALDQYGYTIASNFQWTATGGTIDASGTFTAGNTAAGGKVVATATGTSISDTATAEVVEGIYFDAKVNFQTATVGAPDGYLPDGGLVYGDRGNGYTYGWNANNVENARQRSGESDHLWATFTHMQREGSFSWEMAVPNGAYMVTIGSGDPDYEEGHRILGEDVVVLEGSTTEANHRVIDSALVTVGDGKLTISNATDDGSTFNKIAWITIRGTTPLDSSAIPISSVQQPKRSALLPAHRGLSVTRMGSTVRVRTNQSAQWCTVRVLDVSGRTLYEAAVPRQGELTIPLRRFSVGAYLLHVTTPERSFIQPIAALR
jgi:hypothetical protein